MPPFPMLAAASPVPRHPVPTGSRTGGPDAQPGLTPGELRDRDLPSRWQPGEDSWLQAMPQIPGCSYLGERVSRDTFDGKRRKRERW